MCCATANVLSQMLTALERDGVARSAVAAELPKRVRPGGIRLLSGGSAYFPAEAPRDPCEGCVQLTARFGLRDTVFPPGRAWPIDASVKSEPAAAPARPGWLARLRNKFTGR